MTAIIGRKQPLPAKEESLFKQVVKMHEGRQYKKALKLVDQILKKCPDHGETLAMKGINLFCLYPERRVEAHELAKAALKADMQSHMCWHVFGILHKSDRDYQQAAKCYLNALKWDPENLNLFRDLSNIQMQIRDVKGLVETASKMLSLRSTNRANWMLLAVAHHMDKNHSTAADVLESYLKTQEGNGAQESGAPIQDRVEFGEIELYRAGIMHEAGQHDAAMQLLTDRAPRICDRLGKMELQASIQFSLGNLEEAANLYRRLITSIPDNYDYHRGLCRAMELPDGSEEASAEVTGKLVTVYAELAEQHPRCNAIERIPLDFLSGEKFVKAARARIDRFAKKGIWALFSDLRPLLDNSAKEPVLWQEATAALKEASGEEVVWLSLYVAQHACYMGRMDAAVEHVTAAEAAVDESDTRVEVFCTKADVLAAVGDPEGASCAADAARRLDLSDRYVNSMAAKYMFRNSEVTRAKDTALLFTRGSNAAAAPSDLLEMQVMWYEIESARAHFKLGDLAMALKMFRAVLTHFDEFREDQWDFHGYCLRKVTLRAYIDMLHMEDGIYSAQAYRDAAVGAIQCYISLHDTPPGAEAAEADQKKMQDMTDSQKKKFLDKKKKEAAKLAKTEAEKMEKDRAAHNAKKNAGKFDEDPLGKKLIATEQPLADAEKVAHMLKTHAAEDMRTHVAAFDVAERLDKPHLALKAAKQAVALDADSPDAHALRVQASLWLEKRLPQIEIQVAREGMEADLQKLTGFRARFADGKKWGELNEDFLKQAGGAAAPLCAHFAFARVCGQGTDDLPAAAKKLANVDLGASKNTVSECVEVYTWMKGVKGAEDSVKTFFSKAQAAHPFSSIFSGAKRLPLPEDGLAERMQGLSTGEKQAE